MEKYSIVILAGGKSSRMGQDKALIPFLGKTLLEFILDQIAGMGDEQLIITNSPQDYERFGLPVFPDVIPDIGALGGIFSALTYASNLFCLLLACDMPFVNKPLLEYMAGLIPAYDAVIPRMHEDEYAEPFRAFYSKTCLAPVENCIIDGERKVVSFFDSVNIHFLNSEKVHQFDPDELTFFNVNTPSELEIAKKLVKRL